jgi:hypothetical protein
VPGGEEPLERPVGGRRAAVEEARLGEEEGAGTDAGQVRAAGVRPAQEGDGAPVLLQLFADVGVEGGDHHQVRGAGPGHGRVTPYLDAARGADQGTIRRGDQGDVQQAPGLGAGQGGGQLARLAQEIGDVDRDAAGFAQPTREDVTPDEMVPRMRAQSARGPAAR